MLILKQFVSTIKPTNCSSRLKVPEILGVKGKKLGSFGFPEMPIIFGLSSQHKTALHRYTKQTARCINHLQQMKCLQLFMPNACSVTQKSLVYLRQRTRWHNSQKNVNRTMVVYVFPFKEHESKRMGHRTTCRSAARTGLESICVNILIFEMQLQLWTIQGDLSTQNCTETFMLALCWGNGYMLRLLCTARYAQD